MKTVEPLQSRHTHKKLSTFRPSRKASPSGKKEKRRTLCVCVCGVICPKSFSRHSQQKKPEIPIDEFPDPFPASRLLKIFFGNPDSCCETVNISKILKSQETVGGFFFSNARVYVVSRPEEKEGGKRRESKKKKLFDHQRPPQFVLFIISERARRTNTM